MPTREGPLSSKGANENIHSDNTINNNAYLIPSMRTLIRKCTVSYAGPILSNYVL